MINWHLSTCRRPDVVFLEDIGAPTCFNCGEIGTINEAPSTSALNNPPETPPQASFELSWPASLPLIGDVPDDNGSAEQSKPANPTAVEAFVVGETPAATDVERHRTAPAKTSSYEALHSRKIRILRLLPGKYHDPIRCKIRTVDLHFKTEYEALSYTWADANGDTSLSQLLYVGDRCDILRITANCASALRRLRFPALDRWRDLWVDAICIDQHDIYERSHQVGMMRDIYGMAKRVLIYIGEKTKESKPDTSVPWTDRTKDREIKFLRHLIHKAYFTRMWVIQEVASAKTAWILYGSRGLVWKDVNNPVVNIPQNYGLFTSSHRWMRLAEQSQDRGMDELLTFMLSTTRCHATDPRDKLFALLGLFRGAQEVGLTPDYALSCAQVFTGLTPYFLKRHPESWYRIFSMCSSSPSQGMPSWAINWAEPIRLCSKIDASGWYPRVYLMAKEEQDDAREPSGLKATSFANSNEADEVRLVRGDDFIRFHQDGSLILRGFSPYSLKECWIDSSAAQRNPIITGVHYIPLVPTSEREARLATIPWARKKDKVFVVAGLAHHLLILRPAIRSTKYTYVGICDPPSLYVNYHLVKCLSHKAALLISAWNTLMANVNPNCWIDAEFWASIKRACKNIKCLAGDWDESPSDVFKETRTKWIHSGDAKAHNIPPTIGIDRRFDVTHEATEGVGELQDELWISAREKTDPTDSLYERTFASYNSRYDDSTYNGWIRSRAGTASEQPSEWPKLSREIPDLLAERPLGIEPYKILKIVLGHDLHKLRLEAEACRSRRPKRSSGSPQDDPQGHSLDFKDLSRWGRSFSKMWLVLRPYLGYEAPNKWSGPAKETADTKKNTDTIRHSKDQLVMAWSFLTDLMHETEQQLFPLEEVFTTYPFKEIRRADFWAFPPFVSKAEWKDIRIG